MAIQTLNTIKNWFKTSLKPSQAQFWDTWDSFRHKFEKVPVKDVEGIDELLLTKADKATLDNHLADKIAHAPQVNTDWNSESGVSQLINKPEFKTINGENIVGDGDITLDLDNLTFEQVLSNGNETTQSALFKSYADNDVYTNTISAQNIEMTQSSTVTRGENKTASLTLSSELIDLVNSNTGETTALFAQGVGFGNLNSNHFSTLGMNPATTANYSTILMPAITTEEETKTLATLDDIPTILPVSATQSGIVDNTSLQELGGVDKTIRNVRIGKGAGTVTGSTVLGDGALGLNTTGVANTAIGSTTLRDNTTGGWNTALGYLALRENTIGTQSTAVGAFSLYKNTTGTSNTAIGINALSTNTTGMVNTAIGGEVLKVANADYNTGLGSRSLIKVTSGGKNTGNGAGAGATITTGEKNTAVGYLAIGNEATVTSTGSSNIAVGYQAGRDLTSGSANILLETQEGGTITSGNNNIVINSGKNNAGIKTGSNNTIVGAIAGLPADTSNSVIISDGSRNIAIRKEADNRLLAPTLTNALIDSGGAKSLVTKEYLDGHSGGSQNLQEILNTGNEAINTELVINETNNNLNSKTRVTGSFVDVFNISKKTNTTVNAGSIQGNGKNEDGSLQSSNMLNFTGRIEDGIANFKFNPLKPAGTYTLATLDDITGSSQNLQQTLNNGAGATLTSPNGLNQVGIDFLAYDSVVFTGISGNYGENGSSFVGVYNDSPLLRRISASGSQLLLKIEEPSDEGDSSKHTIIQIPAKPSRFEPYTLATLDDINRSSTSQNLQQTLDKGGFAKSNSAAPAELTLIGDATEKILRFYVQKSDGNSSSETSTVADGILLTNSNISENKTAIIAINQGKLFLQQYKTSTGLSTKLTLEEPTVNTNIVVPAPSTAGTYTVALAENLPITIENDVIEEAQTSTQMDILYPNLRTNDKVIFKKFINGSKYAYEKISTGWIAYAIVIVP